MSATCSMIKQFLKPRWILLTLLIIALIGGFIRLGFWQLDRLAQRKAANGQIQAQLAAQPLDLNQLAEQTGLEGLAYRQVVVRGRFDFAHQVALRNQVYQGQLGFHLLTPLLIDGSQEAVLVDRGWVPIADEARSHWSQYDQPGLVVLTGQIAQSQAEGGFGVTADPQPAPGQSGLDSWRWVNIPRLQQQIPEKLLPIFVRQAPEGSPAELPYPSLVQPDLSDGPHLSYAIQWFTFATLLAAGYPYFVYRQLSGKEKVQAGSAGLLRRDFDPHGHHLE